MNQKTTIVFCLAIFGAISCRTRLMGGSNPQVITSENTLTANELWATATPAHSVGEVLMGEAKAKLA
jgi:hypothetical protein